jgi:hypothetical protein
MMPLPAESANVAHLIQLSVAPVFLLAGIGGIISVISSRIGRVFERSQSLAAAYEGSADDHQHSRIQELAVLSKRITYSLSAISLCTVSELLICIVIAIHFIGGLAGWDVSYEVAIIFIMAMTCLIVGLLCFLREIFLAMSSMRIGNTRLKARLTSRATETHRSNDL